MTPVDLLLIEGFKRNAHPKLVVFRRANGKPLLAPEDPMIMGVASDGPVPEVSVPVIDLDRVDRVADFVLGCCGLEVRRR
jgi:molybdopterin-guanine dinucleotide biosynthesis protein B